ncbi:MAG TPA: hypothetical protein VFJ58_18670 [Armatimonadota bacterium]|nr:hypothetical protein [Armatimonadota bacterium]
MSDVIQRDFLKIISQPILAYDEGLRFFRGVGLMNETLRRLARDLDTHGIAYSVIGAVALNQHGYQRFTTDIDLLMTEEGLRKFTAELVGRGYRPAFTGAVKTFRSTAENVPIEIIISGEYPGDGKPKPVVFPEPSESSVEINGVSTISIEKLVELKLASGMTGIDRRKDLADVQELIRAVGLGASFAERLDPSVRAAYVELHDELVQAREQRLGPGREPGR